MVKGIKPTIAMVSMAGGYDSKNVLDFSKKNGFEAIEWSLDITRIPISNNRRRRLFKNIVKASTHFSFHAPSVDVEIAHSDDDICRMSMSLLKKNLDFLSELGNDLFFTVHIGSGELSAEEVSWEKGIKNLAELVEYGRKRGIMVLIENLRYGLTGNPKDLSNLASETGSMVTFDIGHVNGGRWVKEGFGTAMDFFKEVSPFVRSAHIYEFENSDPIFHRAPQDLSNIGQILRELLEIKCEWWVIELWEDIEELLMTRKLIEHFLNENYLAE